MQIADFPDAWKSFFHHAVHENFYGGVARKIISFSEKSLKMRERIQTDGFISI
jgi:hypothetical protein